MLISVPPLRKGIAVAMVKRSIAQKKAQSLLDYRMPLFPVEGAPAPRLRA